MASYDNIPGHELSPPVPGGRTLSPPVSLEEAIARSTREMRLARGLTLAELAEKVGISRAMLSKIENAQTSCSLATLAALAKGLDVPATSLFRGADRDTEAIFVEAGSAPEVIRRGSNLGHNFQLLGTLKGRHQSLEPLLVTLTDESKVFPLFQHAGSEFIYMLEGIMDYRHQDTTFRLEPGDSITFDAEGTHGPSALIKTPIRFLSVYSEHEKPVGPIA